MLIELLHKCLGIQAFIYTHLHNHLHKGIPAQVRARVAQRFIVLANREVSRGIPLQRRDWLNGLYLGFPGIDK